MKARFGARVLRVLVLALLGLLIGLPLAAELALQSGGVRERLRPWLVREASRALDARVELGRIDALDLHTFAASGLRISRGAQPLLIVDRFALAWNPLALAAKRVSITRAKLERVWLELGAPFEAHGGGLPELFEDGEQEQPASKSDSSGLSVAIQALRVHDLRARLRIGAAHYSIDRFELAGALETGHGLALHADRVDFDVLRAERALGRVHGDGLRYFASGAANGHVRLEVGGADAELGLTLGAPRANGAQSIDASLEARAISSRTLAALSVDGSWLATPIDLALHASGTTHDGMLGARLTSRGGELALEAHLTDAARVQGSLHSEQLELASVLRGVRAAPLAFTLGFTGSARPDRGAYDARVVVIDASYDHAALPEIEARGRLARSGALSVDSLAVRDAAAGARLEASARFEADGAFESTASATVTELERAAWLRHLVPGLAGSLELHAHAERDRARDTRAELSLDARALGIQTASASRLHLRATASGRSLDQARANARLELSDARFARVHFTRAALELRADPRRYDFRADFGAQGGLRLHAERSKAELHARGDGEIDLGRGQRLRLELSALRYAHERVTLDRLALRVGRASAQLDGWLDSMRRGELALLVRVPDMRGLSALVLSSPIAGSLALDARVQGELRSPTATLSLRCASAHWLGLSQAALELDARAELPKRRVELRANLTAHNTALEVELHSELGSRVLSRRNLERARHDILLDIGSLPLTELSVFPRARLRMREAELSGRIHAQGDLRTPELDAQLAARGSFERETKPLALSLQAAFAHERLHAELEADDAYGRLFEAQVSSDFRDGEPLARSVAELAHVLTARPWELRFDFASRRIDDLPAVHALSLEAALLPWRVSARGRLEHKPGQEPEGQLQLDAAFKPSADEQTAPRCGVEGAPRVLFAATMHEGTLATTTRIQVRERDHMRLTTRSHAPLDTWLGPSSIEPVEAAADFDQLQLSALPFVCERADGLLTGRLHLARRESHDAELSAELKAEALRWVNAPSVDAYLRARVDQRHLLARLDVEGAGGAATIEARLALDPDGSLPRLRSDLPVTAEVRLQEMSVAALLGALPDVSADSGVMDGVVTLDGSLARPALHGSLALRQVSVTLGRLGQRFEDVTGQLAFQGRRVRLSRTRVHDRNGQLELWGECEQHDDGRVALTLFAHAKSYPLRREGVVLGHADGDAQLRATLGPGRDEFELVLRKAAIVLYQEDIGQVQSLAPNPDLVFLDSRDGKAVTRSDASTTVLRLEAREPLWVRSDNFSALIRTQLTIVSSTDTPDITGAIDIERGTVLLIGQLFDIERGRIEFAGGHAVEPTLDLTATRQVPGGAHVSVEAQGRLHQLQLTYLVDDKALSAEEALAALSGAGSAPGAFESQLGAVAGGLAAGIIGLGARQQLGDWVPVLAIESGGSQTSVRAGIEARRLIPQFLRRLVVDAYVEGMVSSAQDSAKSDSATQPQAGPTSAGLLLELRFPHNLVGEAQYGPGQRWSADLGWEPRP